MISIKIRNILYEFKDVDALKDKYIETKLLLDAARAMNYRLQGDIMAKDLVISKVRELVKVLDEVEL